MTVIASYWLSFEYACDPRGKVESGRIGRGVYQVMAMIAPFLFGESKGLLEKLSHEYLSQRNHCSRIWRKSMTWKKFPYPGPGLQLCRRGAAGELGSPASWRLRAVSRRSQGTGRLAELSRG
jgi:hypothetical protein